MNVIASGARQSLSYVFTAAANAGSAKSTDSATTQPGAGVATQAPVSGSSADAAATARAGAMSAEEARQNLLDFLENPDTAHLKMRRVTPSIISYASPAEQAANKANIDAMQAWEAKMGVQKPDPNAPLHVGHRPDSIAGPVSEYFMLRGEIAARRAAGQSVTLLEGRNETPVDPDQYLETLRQAAIASVQAQGTVDKTA